MTGESNDRADLVEAFRAWHRGEPLTERQRDLIDQARIQCLARAYGVDLGPAFAVPQSHGPRQEEL